jgi:hypothetical protein
LTRAAGDMVKDIQKKDIRIEQLIKQKAEKTRKEKIKNEKIKQLLKENADLKRAHKEHLKRSKAFEDIKKASLKKSKKEKIDGVRNVLLQFFTEPVVDRMVTNSPTNWSTPDLLSATSLLCVSAKAYRYLHKHKIIYLPAVSVLRSRIAKINLKEGIIEPAMIMLEARGKVMRAIERQVVLSFDEIHLNTDAMYDQAEDKVAGPSEKAQVAMARGLYSNWKSPVFYGYVTL